MQLGKVYLVGAGPGDPDLITVKGRDVLQLADVIVYDYLANPALLAYKKETAEVIYAGKTRDRHTLRQEEINDLLVENALAGKVVVRLKGGDPFVFGRGGEEAQALQKAGVPFQIVPGVSSAIAVPAYAGIPVTHRDFVSSFTVIAGHEAGETGSSPRLDWHALATSGGTLIFLMGMSQLASIAARLVEAGRPASTPVACVRWGTLPEQQTVVGTLSDIAGRVREAGLTAPATIIIGEVVRLRESLAWFEPVIRPQ